MLNSGDLKVTSITEGECADINMFLEAFEKAVKHFLDEANNDREKKKQVIELLRWAYKNFTRDCRLFIALSCPGGDSCPDGSCPPC